MLVEDLDDHFTLEQNLLLLDSFQLFNLIAGLKFEEISNLMAAQTSDTAIAIYYRLPTQLRRKLFKSSPSLKSLIKIHESKHPISVHFAPVIIFNTFDLIPEIMANKIKHNSHLLEFFIKDFMVLQDIDFRFQGILYLRDIIKLIHNKRYHYSLIPRIVINHKINENNISNTIDEDNDQLIFHNYFTVENTNHNVLGAINIDYVLDDYILVQEQDSMNDQIFYLKDKQKLLNMMFILVSTVLSTCIIGSIAAIMHFPAKVIIVCDVLTSINDGILIVAAQDDLETHEIIAYSLILAAVIQCIFLVIYTASSISIIKAGLIALTSILNSLISMIVILFGIKHKYSIGQIILIIDAILISTMFILNKILTSNVYYSI